MKSILKFLFVIGFLTSCKSWDPATIGVKKEPLNPKLLTLDKKIEDVANTVIYTNQDQMKLFGKEVEDNLTDPYGDKYGQIIMKQNILKFKMGLGWTLFDSFLLGVPILFGSPIGVYGYSLEIELRIMDSQNKLIGKYSAVGKAKCTAAMYHGYRQRDAIRKSYVDAVNNAFDQIRPQILADVTRLNDKLKEAGKK